MKIGVFDSGIGGLTILKALTEVSPNNEYIYFGDTLNLPYGDKKVDELKELSNKIIKFLISHNVEAIVIACGTLSSTIYDSVKTNYDVKIYDIINPIIKSIQKTNLKKVLLLGTEKTIQTKLFEEKLSKIGIEVFVKACPKFVPIIENKIDEPLVTAIGEYLYDFKDLGIEVIIPGCTHYGLISEEISEYTKIPCLDIGLLIAEEVNPTYSISDVKIYFSKVTPEIKEAVNLIFGDLEIIEKVL